MKTLDYRLKKEGFTLIELLVVIAIIGVLAAIAVPNYLTYRSKTYCTYTETDANSIAVAIAETVGGTEPQFIERMNATARRLGAAVTVAQQGRSVLVLEHGVVGRGEEDAGRASGTAVFRPDSEGPSASDFFLSFRVHYVSYFL